MKSSRVKNRRVLLRVRNKWSGCIAAARLEFPRDNPKQIGLAAKRCAELMAVMLGCDVDDLEIVK